MKVWFCVGDDPWVPQVQSPLVSRTWCSRGISHVNCCPHQLWQGRVCCVGTAGSGVLTIPVMAQLMCRVYSMQIAPTGADRQQRSGSQRKSLWKVFRSHFRISKWVALTYDQGTFQTVAFSRGLRGSGSVHRLFKSKFSPPRGVG